MLAIDSLVNILIMGCGELREGRKINRNENPDDLLVDLC